MFLGIGSFYDMKSKEIPGGFLYFSIGLGFLCNIFMKYQPMKEFLIGGFIGCVFLGIGWMTNEEIGYGDGLALVFLGILKGWKGLIPLMFFSFMLSGVYGMWKLLGRKEERSSTMPFFPFLLISSIGMIMI